MSKKFSQFVEDNIVRQGDISVGLRDGENAQFDFPGDGIKDVDGNYLLKYRTAGDTATNWVEFTNSLTGQPVIVAADGNDENVSLIVKSHADGTLVLLSPQNGDIDIALGGSGNINFVTNAGFLYVNETDPYDAVSDDVTLSADSSTTLPTQHAVKTYVDNSTPVLSQTFITNTDETGSLPNSDPLSTKATGILASTTTTGALTTRVLTGTTNQIDIADGDGAANPTFTLSSTIVTPGTLTLGGTFYVTGQNIEATSGNITLITDGASAIDLDSPTILVEQDIVHAGDPDNKITFGTDTQNFQTGGSSRMDISDTGVRLGGTDARITAISDDTTMAADSSTLGVTQHAVKTYVDASTPTLNQTFITQTDETGSLPNSVPLSGLSTGFLANTTGTGVLTPRTLTGTTNQIDVANGDGSGVPTFSLSSTLIAPGTFEATMSINIGGAGATVTSISTDGTFAANSDTLLSTQKAIKTYVDATVQPFQFGMAALVATSNITLSGIQVVDGVATTTQVVLAQNQTSPVDNGLYTANTLGAWTRTVGYTTWANFYRLIVTITDGLTQKGTAWQCLVDNTGTVGVDDLPFSSVAFQTYTAGTGLTLSDNTFSLTAPVTIALGGTNTSTAIGASGTIAQSDGTKYTFTTATYPTTGGSAGTILRSDGTNIVNSTATFANTYTASNLLYSNGSNTVTGLATANSGVLVTNSTGVPAWSSTMTNGQVIIGSTGATPTAATLTQGTGITISNSAGGITITNSDPASGVTLTNVGGTETLVFDGVGPALGIKGLSVGSGLTLSSNATSVTYALTAPVTIALGGTNTTSAIGASGTLAQSDGSKYTWTTATYPSTAGTAGKIHISDGTNIVASTPTYPNTATSGKILRGDGTNIALSTSTFADTYSASTILYSNGANTVTGLATANSAVLVTNSSGVPAWSSTMTNGQLIIGSTSGTPTAATITAGTGISVTNGAGAITIAGTGAITTTEVTGTSQSMAVNNRYIANNASLVTLTLPATAALGDFVEVRGKGAGLFKIAQNASQLIRWVSSVTTTGTGGSLTAIERYDAIRIECITANTDWIVVDNTGTYTIV